LVVSYKFILDSVSFLALASEIPSMESAIRIAESASAAVAFG
jgi:hypothetical protein